VTDPSYQVCLVEAELRARATYAEPHRRYHTERHLDECLNQVDRPADLAERDRRRLRWALLWHDAVYEPGARDNEARSAALAKTELTACDVDPADVAEVVRLILLTESHRAPADDYLGALMVSIDLSILGSDPQRYREYSAATREEYGHVPDELWRAGRSAVLRRMLDAEALYPDARFRDALEAQARANMTDELRALGGD
jgi:predicted metal-dependent HD superfamily phosphohydrolase